jgi:hypothetical protein
MIFFRSIWRRVVKEVYKTAKILNKVGLSSDDTVAKTEASYKAIVSERIGANNLLTKSIDNVAEAQKRASVSVADRIKIGEAELKYSKNKKFLEDKQKDKAKEEVKNKATPKVVELTKEQKAENDRKLEAELALKISRREEQLQKDILIIDEDAVEVARLKKKFEEDKLAIMEKYKNSVVTELELSKQKS